MNYRREWEWIMGIIIRDYIGTTIEIHSPIPSEAPRSLPLSTFWNHSQAKGVGGWALQGYVGLGTAMR